MSKKNKQALKRYIYLCFSLSSIMISSEIQAIKTPSEDESKQLNLIGPKSLRTAKHPKYNWEEKNPQDSIRKDKASPVNYFTKIHPERLSQALKSFSNSKNSFIIKRDDNENPEYDDQR